MPSAIDQAAHLSHKRDTDTRGHSPQRTTAVASSTHAFQACIVARHWRNPELVLVLLTIVARAKDGWAGATTDPEWMRAGLAIERPSDSVSDAQFGGLAFELEAARPGLTTVLPRLVVHQSTA